MPFQFVLTETCLKERATKKLIIHYQSNFTHIILIKLTDDNWNNFANTGECN